MTGGARRRRRRRAGGRIAEHDDRPSTSRIVVDTVVATPLPREGSDAIRGACHHVLRAPSYGVHFGAPASPRTSPQNHVSKVPLTDAPLKTSANDPFTFLSSIAVMVIVLEDAPLIVSILHCGDYSS